MDNNHLSPIIYVAESPEQVINYRWESVARFIDKRICVLLEEDVRKLGQGNENFLLPYDLNPGDVLIRHPYNQGYVLATDAEDEYLKDVAEGIFLISRCLGASKITYKKCDIAESKREFQSNNDVSYKVVNLEAEVKKSEEQKLLNKIVMTREFLKQEFTQEQFDKAKSIAEERGLLVSKDIRSLLDARDPKFGAPMTQQTVKVEISSSLNKMLDIAFTLNVGSIFKLGSNTKIATEKKLDLCIEWDIKF